MFRVKDIKNYPFPKVCSLLERFCVLWFTSIITVNFLTNNIFKVFNFHELFMQNLYYQSNKDILIIFFKMMIIKLTILLYIIIYNRWKYK